RRSDCRGPLEPRSRARREGDAEPTQLRPVSHRGDGPTPATRTAARAGRPTPAGPRSRLLVNIVTRAVFSALLVISWASDGADWTCRRTRWAVPRPPATASPPDTPPTLPRPGRAPRGAHVDALALARWQFAITTVYHFIFVPLTIGLAPLVAIMQTAWVRTGNERWLRLTKFFGKLLLINFALGVVTGIVQEFQFGMNWSEYSRFVGDVFGAPLAMEAL